MPTPQISRPSITHTLERKAEDVEHVEPVDNAADVPMAAEDPSSQVVTPPSGDGPSGLPADAAPGRSIAALSSDVDREAGAGWGVGSLIVGGLVGAVGLAGAFVHSVTNSIVDHYDKGPGKPASPPPHAPVHDQTLPAAAAVDDQKVGSPGKEPSRASALEVALKDFAVFDAPGHDVQAVHVTTDPLIVSQVVPHAVL